jgi:hypothetical protein
MYQVSQFHYSVPFTLDGKAHAKQIEDQWTRTTILEVKEPFPYMLTRQLVIRRTTRDCSPIEVSMNDIDDRIETMEMELGKDTRSQADINNLMRLVQGTVMPQVHLRDLPCSR